MAKRDDIPKTDPSEIEALIQRLKRSNFRRNQKGLSLVEALLILVVIIISGNVGNSRQASGKGLGNAGGASESGAKQIQQKRGRIEGSRPACVLLTKEGHRRLNWVERF